MKSLLRSPGFTAIAVLTLALGIGASTAIFSVVHAVLLSPLRYADSAALVQIRSAHPEQGQSALAPATFVDVATRSQSFSVAAAQTLYYYNLTKIGPAARVTGVQATADYFKLWGVQPIHGRTWREDETRTGAAPVVVLSETIWRRHYGANPALLGQPIWIDDVAVTVIGIMPAWFSDPWGNGTVWRPIPMDGDTARDRTSRYWGAYARLRPGVTLAQANAELGPLAAGLVASAPDHYRGWTLVASDLRRAVVGDYRTGLLVVLGAVGCVMLITCANVAGLNVVRATARRKELALRTALGASRGQLLRELLGESLLLAALGGLGGLLLGSWGIDALLASLPAGWLPRADEIGLDGPVLAAAFLLTLLTGLAFGLAPGFTAARVDAAEALKDNARASASPSARRLRSALVVTEIALAFVLLVAAGLLVRSWIALLDQPAGFDAARVLSVTVSLSETRYDTPEKRRAFYDRALAEVAGVPGVAAAGFTHTSPFRWGIPLTFVAVGRDGTAAEANVPRRSTTPSAPTISAPPASRSSPAASSTPPTAPAPRPSSSSAPPPPAASSAPKIPSAAPSPTAPAAPPASKSSASSATSAAPASPTTPRSKPTVRSTSAPPPSPRSWCAPRSRPPASPPPSPQRSPASTRIRPSPTSRRWMRSSAAASRSRASTSRSSRSSPASRCSSPPSASTASSPTAWPSAPANSASAPPSARVPAPSWRRSSAKAPRSSPSAWASAWRGRCWPRASWATSSSRRRCTIPRSSSSSRCSSRSRRCSPA